MKPPEVFCRRILPAVSRTFALNIPVLPAPLDLVVTVAYLLCRIADTLEDEAQGSVVARVELLHQFAYLAELPVGWQIQVQNFCARAQLLLRAETPAAELELLLGTPQVLEAFAELPLWTRPHLARCVRIMTDGMAEVSASLHGARAVDGLADLAATLRYCYFVAGVVGEMLTGLFLEYAPQALPEVEALSSRAAAFGRALQLTNILKDIRDDLERGSCWLPKDRMLAHGVVAATLLLPTHRSRSVALLSELLEVAKLETDAAFEYCLHLPASEPGLRLFCLWPLFFAVLTQNALKGNPQVFEATPVKISREGVQAVMVATQERVSSDEALRTLYRECTEAFSPVRNTGT